MPPRTSHDALSTPSQRTPVAAPVSDRPRSRDVRTPEHTEGRFTKGGVDMNGQIGLGVALGVVVLCSVAVVVTLPAMALAAARANLRGAIRLGVVTVVAVSLAIVVAAVVGSTPAAYSTLF